MVRDNIAHALPEGVGQPLYTRLLTGDRTLTWVRAGDIRRVGCEWVFQSRWDGEGFAILWEAAAAGGTAETSPKAEFAVVVQGRLEVLASIALTPRVEGRVGSAARDAERARRGWRVGRGRW